MKSKKKSKGITKQFYSVLGGMLRMRRIQMGLTQKEVAKKLRHSDTTTVSGMETGTRVVLEAHLAKLAAMLLINPHQVYEAWHLDAYRRKQRLDWAVLNKRQGLV